MLKKRIGGYIDDIRNFESLLILLDNKYGPNYVVEARIDEYADYHVRDGIDGYPTKDYEFDIIVDEEANESGMMMSETEFFGEGIMCLEIEEL